MADNGNMQLAQRAIPFPVDDSLDQSTDFGSTVISWLLPKDGSVPPRWSRARDEYLAGYWEEIDQLKVAVTTFVSKVLSIPFTIQAKDTNIFREVARAERFDDNLQLYSGTSIIGPLRGFNEAFSQFTQDYLTQDNGAFMFIMGNEPGDKPILGTPLGLLHLPSSQCTRTSNPEFPVVYHHHIAKNKVEKYALHWSRVIAMSHLPSPRQSLNGVGLCPVSCCLTAATELWNMYRYSEEKFGSRPAKQILLVETGATIENLNGALAHWQAKMDNAGQSHFASTLLLAPSDPSHELKLSTLDLASAPDGFDRKEASMQDAALVAAAFGLDLLDLAMSFGIQGQTRANADVQTRKGRGKGPGLFLESFIHQLALRFLPDSLRAAADNVDDDQDEQRAQIANERSQAYARQIQFGVGTIRSIRVDMLKNGEITQDAFNHLELEDGRLPSGMSVMALFESDDPDYQRWLNDAETLEDIEEQRKVIYSEYSDATDADTLHKMEADLSALREKENELKAVEMEEQMEEEEMEEEEVEEEEQMEGSARSAERSELEGDEEDRETQRDQVPDDNQMKATRIIPDDPQGWQGSEIDPYSMTDREVKRAISTFNNGRSTKRMSGILDASVD
jgi:hypothetical protein